MANSRIVHLIPDEGNDSISMRDRLRMRSPTQRSQLIDKAFARKYRGRKYRERMMRNYLAGSRRARRTPTAREGIVSGTNLPVPPALVRLRRSSLYTELPSSICREELDRCIEEQILEDNMEDEYLVEAWTSYYEDVWLSLGCSYNGGFGVSGV